MTTDKYSVWIEVACGESLDTTIARIKELLGTAYIVVGVEFEGDN